MMCHLVCTGLTCSTSSIHRDVIHAHGHSGSNQKSAIFLSLVTFCRNTQAVRVVPTPRDPA